MRDRDFCDLTDEPTETCRCSLCSFVRWLESAVDDFSVEPTKEPWEKDSNWWKK
jgi:hypothetical protein